MSSAPIRIKATIENGLYRIKVTGGEASFPPFSSNAAATEISNFREEYQRRIHQARRLLGDANPHCEVRSASNFFCDLHALGRNLFFMIAASRAAELTDLFQKQNKFDEIADPESAPMMIELETPESVFLPIEIFPLKNTHTQNPVDKQEQLRKQARCFLGMSAIVRRLPWPEEPAQSPN